MSLPLPIHSTPTPCQYDEHSDESNVADHRHADPNCESESPEDCGGVWGYANLLELASKKRKSEDEKERLEWYEIDQHFDPNFFDQEEEEYFIEETWEDLMSLDKELRQEK